MSKDYVVTALPADPTARQVAEKVVEEMENLGYLVSFFNEDVLDTDQAMLLLSRTVLERVQ